MFNFYPPYTSTSINRQVSVMLAINDFVGARKTFVSSAEPKPVDFCMFYYLCRQSAPHMHRTDKKDHSFYITFPKVAFYCVNFDYEIVATTRSKYCPKISLDVQKLGVILHGRTSKLKLYCKR